MTNQKEISVLKLSLSIALGILIAGFIGGTISLILTGTMVFSFMKGVDNAIKSSKNHSQITTNKAKTSPIYIKPIEHQMTINRHQIQSKPIPKRKIIKMVDEKGKVYYSDKAGNY